jgi:adenosylcobinamide kinase / adenosylcobinamide-phosphate guanylyltransferase
VAIVLIGGGARSGKSRHALELARKRGSRLVFLATAEALDEEMAARVAKHRAERGAEFSTIEEPLEIVAAFHKIHDADAIVIDCLTLWLSNIMLTFGRDVDTEVEKLIQAAQSSPAAVIAVTNEVGCGIVPESTLGRDFRDHAGILNQRVAAAAEEVYWMIFGQPLRVK